MTKFREGDTVATASAIEVNHTTVAAGSTGKVIDIDPDTGDLLSHRLFYACSLGYPRLVLSAGAR
jgi:hypothetical protein